MRFQLVNLRTVSISFAAFDLDRPEGFDTGEAVWSVSPLQHFMNRESASISPMSWSSHTVKRSVSASLAGEGFHDERRAGCMRMDQWCVGVGGLSRLRAIITSEECEKCFSSSGTRIDGRSLQTDSTIIMRDQKEHADTEGEVQMGTTRADGRRRLDEEAGNSVTMLRLL